ncbi:MAG: hypothetical protein ACI9LD_001566 [Polaromonas sp.]|jgi:hypothetical protein
MIQAMRFLVLALMMVLLPLRSWTGDAMATDMALSMAAQQMHQTAAAKADADPGHPSDKGHSDHAAHAAPTEVTTSTVDCLSHADCDQTRNAGQNAGHCDSCSACQACHNVALLVNSDELKRCLNSVWTSTLVADPFASADAAHGQKPPIS